MNQKRWLLAATSLLLAAYVVAQNNQTSTSQSKTGNGTATSSASASSSSSGNRSSSSSANGGRNAFGNGSGSGSNMGFAGKPTHAILYAVGSTSPQMRQVAFTGHTNYLGELQKKGKVLLFGPWRDLPGSMAIVLANDDAEAMAIAQNDPAVRSGSLTFEVRAWNVMMPEGNGSGGTNTSGGSNNSGGSSGGGSNSGGSKSSGGNSGGGSGGSSGGSGGGSGTGTGTGGGSRSGPTSG